MPPESVEDGILESPATQRRLLSQQLLQAVCFIFFFYRVVIQDRTTEVVKFVRNHVGRDRVSVVRQGM
jgi:hypothetical protein